MYAQTRDCLSLLEIGLTRRDESDHAQVFPSIPWQSWQRLSHDSVRVNPSLKGVTFVSNCSQYKSRWLYFQEKVMTNDWQNNG
jgi:hypothetical protein